MFEGYLAVGGVWTGGGGGSGDIGIVGKGRHDADKRCPADGERGTMDEAQPKPGQDVRKEKAGRIKIEKRKEKRSPTDPAIVQLDGQEKARESTRKGSC